MDGLSSLATATTLLQQAFHLFRHVSSARRFADSAGTLSAMIAVEYFRFETWLQQSGLLATDPASQEMVVSESSLRRSILLAAEMQSINMDYERVERHIFIVIGQAHHCLQQLQQLREKYALAAGATVDAAKGSDVPAPSTKSEISGAQPLFENSRVAKALSSDAHARQRRAKVVSFFRKVQFTWSFSEDTSDRDRILAHVQTLKYCNDTLRECLPPLDRQAADRLVNIKALALAANPSDLKGVGSAAHAVQDQLHEQIYQAVMLKAKRVETSSQNISEKELEEVQLDRAHLAADGSDLETSAETSTKRALSTYSAGHHGAVSAEATVILEYVSFNTSLAEDDLDLLKERIATLCTLLHSAGHPYFAVLPLCEGFFQINRASFALAYRLPSFAAPDQPPSSLYSILPHNKYSLNSEKASTSRIFLPTLEQRYDLAAALADGVLSLLGVTWVHKALSSHNVVLYNTRQDPTASAPLAAATAASRNRLDFRSPQLLGFGVARREQRGERTVDLRDGGSSPWRFWAHPELRSGAEQHRRFEARFDVFALGVVLFEIGMWQDAHYYCSGGGGAAEEFRRRLVHVCAREMGHRMGEAYKAAVMVCLDGDEVWKGAVGADGESGGEGEGEPEVGLATGMTLSELFYLHVFTVLKGCCRAA